MVTTKSACFPNGNGLPYKYGGVHATAIPGVPGIEAALPECGTHVSRTPNRTERTRTGGLNDVEKLCSFEGVLYGVSF